jgi:Domain of unknown function (DUF4926)
MAVTTRSPIEELDVVEFRHDLHGVRAGTRGAIVSAWPEHDDYTVEVADPEGRGELVSAHAADLRRASTRHRWEESGRSLVLLVEARIARLLDGLRHGRHSRHL